MCVEGNEPGKVLTTAECVALLGGVEVGRVAVPARSGGIDVFPVTFVLHDDVVVFRTAPGTKLDALHESRQVTFEADSVDERDAWSVVIKGSADISKRRLEPGRRFGVDVRSWHPDDKPYLVRLIPKVITGRRFTIDRPSDLSEFGEST